MNRTGPDWRRQEPFNLWSPRLLEGCNTNHKLSGAGLNEDPELTLVGRSFIERRANSVSVS